MPRSNVLLKEKDDDITRRMRNGCALEGIEILQWMYNVRRWCLTKQDVDGLAKGERICLICLDRNVLDVALQQNLPRKSVDVADFFRDSVVTYTNHRAPHGYVSGDRIAHSELQPFVFEVHLTGDDTPAWYPLSADGTLPVFDPQLLALAQRKERLHSGRRPKPWSAFAKDTLVGWRGPMLPLNRLKHLPQRLRKVWYDLEWPRVSCRTWGELSIGEAPPLTHVLERQCAASKRATFPKTWEETAPTRATMQGKKRTAVPRGRTTTRRSSQPPKATSAEAGAPAGR